MSFAGRGFTKHKRRKDLFVDKSVLEKEAGA